MQHRYDDVSDPVEGAIESRKGQTPCFSLLYLYVPRQRSCHEMSLNMVLTNSSFLKTGIIRVAFHSPAQLPQKSLPAVSTG